MPNPDVQSRETPLAETFADGFEKRIVRAQAERDARLTITEARNRLLDALDGARQAHVKPNSIVGDLFGRRPEEIERNQHDGVQVVALADFNAALDKAFPVADDA